MIKVLVNGAKGNMGSQSIKVINETKDLTVVAQNDFGDDLRKTIQETKPDVVVDFTHPSCVMENTKIIIEENCYGVIGTTGLSEENIKTIDKLANKHKKGILIVPNFAIGALLMMKFSEEAAKYLPNVEIIEFHHNKKADAPSGTAIKTAKLIAEINPNINAIKLDEKELISGVRGGKESNIPIHSVRLQGYVASQEVIFGGIAQTLKIRHDTTSRESFMPGVILSIRKVLKLDKLVYGLENLL
jgi:4-hydroxy-tetrahydrodipicolinate reductase